MSLLSHNNVSTVIIPIVPLPPSQLTNLPIKSVLIISSEDRSLTTQLTDQLTMFTCVVCICVFTNNNNHNNNKIINLHS